ncbi:MAG: 16S rRNA (cytosine(1402)-N(4))-methyltransferase RsmH [Acidobacteria bacterium]|nr:16S rRNA (cytosine(1402)-N(4))-methyltransferase RsmH [Acidobacteriota bacterium]
MREDIRRLHSPVLKAEVLEALGAARGGIFVDATLGMGGHSEAILLESERNRVIGFDRDGEALELARERLSGFGDRFTGVQADYRRFGSELDRLGAGLIDGLVADLGVSSWQLDSPERGFSFRFPASPLDMRMDRGSGPTAADLVNGLGERELADLIWRYGEEPAARRIARRIVEARRRSPIRTAGELADLVVRAAHPKGRWRIHPATRTFQALRIAVNNELEGLGEFVAEAVDRLAPGGRLAVITFHSLEDRLIKRAFRFQSGHCVCPPTQPVCGCGAVRRIEVLARKAMAPGPDEIQANPRARSAKLRAAVRLYD